jgi:magnesium-transporting ATPase (P-type)
MEFKKCSIGGHVYSSISKSDNDVDVHDSNAQILRDIPKVLEYLEKGGPRKQEIIQFFTHLSVCHTVLASYEGTEHIDNIQYKAQSPDEAALVKAAKEMGFVFLGRQLTDIHVNVRGENVTYKLLNVLEFDSKRKRMSVIVESASGEIVLFCKGADNVIFELLKGNQREMKAKTLEHLEIFASEGKSLLWKDPFPCSKNCK